MTSDDPRTRRSVADLSRHFLRSAYPDQPEPWIDRQVNDAVRRIDLAAPQQQAYTMEGARRRRGIVLVLAAVVIVALVVVGILLRDLLAAAAVRTTGVYLLVGSVVVTAAATLWTRILDRRAKVLSCRVRINSRLDFEQSDAGDTLSLKGPDGSALDDPGMVVVRVKNLGGATIESEDYQEPLRLRFPGRRVMNVDVTESEPPRVFAKDSGFRIAPDSITLPDIRLEPQDSFKMVIVLSGTKVGVRYEVPVDGQLRQGRITTESTVSRWSWPTIFASSLILLSIGMLAVVLLLNYVKPFATLPPGLVCEPGQLTVEGSSAFGPATTAAAGEYQAYCGDSDIVVRTPGSLEGLNRLRDAPETDRLQRLALSDGKVPESDFPGLVPHPVAVVPFTFVANNKAPVDRLTLDQARKIFTGAVSRWSEITGNPNDTAEIRVVGRTASSGTRRTLERHVLGTENAPLEQADPTSESCVNRRQEDQHAGAIVCERSSTLDLLNRVSAVDYAIGYADVTDVKQTVGVKIISLDDRDATSDGIRAGYPFWTVEYIYSDGPLRDGSLATAFANYLASPEGAKTMARFEYFVCDSSIADLCNSGR
jgi:phosphate transport system substrate-binding protein